MKLISFAIPCYNSQDYMEKCVNTLLPGGTDVEIILVDDGSTDGTAALADRLAGEHPDIIRAVHQENGGHGEAVNTGLREAKGLYFKVVDSDDWVDYDAYMEVIAVLKRFASGDEQLDMLLTNYVYEKVSEHHQRTMFYTPLFPTDKVIGWEDMKRNIKGFSILMHSVIYRTAMLRESGLKLPKHTFYVDNLFVYVPLPHVKRFYYLNVDFYRYYIGREGQSVAEQTMVKRIDQQLRVNYMMVDAFNLWEIEERHLREYMFAYLEMITVISTTIGYVSEDPVNLQKVKDLWAYIRKKDKRTWHHLRYGILGAAMNLPGKAGRKMSVHFYHIAQKFMGFN